MNHGNRVARCHLASLKQDLVPPDPRLHLVAIAPHELAISLGSLVFLRSERVGGRKDVTTDDFCSQSFEYRSSRNTKDHSHTGLIEPRKSDISLRCTLLKDGEPVCNTVSVHLNRNSVRGLREVFSCSGDDTCPPVKHRYTYHGGCSFRLLSGTNFVRCKLLLRRDNCYVFRLKRRLRCQPPASCSVVDESVENNWSSRIANMVNTRGKPSYGGVFGCSDSLIKRYTRRSCSEHRQRLPVQRDHITIPAILQIDTIVRFQLWSKIYKAAPTLVMCNELYVDGDILGKSELNITSTNHRVNCYVDMFYENPTNNVYDEGCDIRSCCCNCKVRLICASHLTRMTEEIRRLISFIFSYGYAFSVNALWRYRYLLYFYLQLLSFSSCESLQSCGKGLPVAILSVGVVDFAYGRMGLPSKGSHYGECYGGFWSIARRKASMDFCRGDEVKITHAPPPKSGLKSYVESSFEPLDICYKENSIKRRVESVYLGSAFKERWVRRAQYFRALNPNVPICGAPIMLTFIMGSDFYKDEHIICSSMRDILVIYSGMYTMRVGVTFLPEPPDLSFVKQLISTPLYNVGISPGTLDSMEVNTSFGAIGYCQINELLWRYQPLLTKSGDALTTFLRFVDWKSVSESSQALEVMYSWHEPDFITLLELLSIDFSPPHVPEAVQRYACDLLIAKYSIDELAVFFPQLVVAPGAHHLLDNLIERSCNIYRIALHLYWTLECWGRNNTGSSHALCKFMSCLERSDSGGRILNAIKSQRLLRQRLNFLMRHIRSQTNGYAYEQSMKLLEFLRSENKLEVFHGLRPRVSANDGQRISFDLAVPLFTDCSLNILAVDTALCSIIKTTRCPLILRLHLTEAPGNGDRFEEQSLSARAVSVDHEFPVNEGVMLVKNIMFKDGDDLRLDQICQQIARLVDNILCSHGVSSYIKYYKVLSTSSKDGFVEFLEDTKPISSILKENGSIESFLIGDDTSLVEKLTKRLNFTGSLASYSVLTHLLGVGDRHNDNLILSKSGHVVHVDYGYILGSDPKFLPLPPFKLSNELIDFLGGQDSVFYDMFKERFYLVFSILRRHAKLIIILIYLLSNHSLRNVNLSSVVEMESKFKLCIQDERMLRQHVNYLIQSSATSLSTRISESLHQFSMWWK